ncbi:MAG: FG-GAP repeat domain-containing protein [Nitrospinales bacterium]
MHQGDRSTPGYSDLTREYFRKIPDKIQSALLTSVNQDELHDLVLVFRGRDGKNRVLLFINTDEGKFSFKRNSGLSRGLNMEVRSIAAGDVNGDHASDLLLLGTSGSRDVARFLFSNKKGYFYHTGVAPLPRLRDGAERVDFADLDGDGDLDLLFTGRNLVDGEGRPAPSQAQIMINNGRGLFSDLSHLLLPPMKPGVTGTSIADYDGDEIVDIFLVYEQGRNVLLINNGLGEFIDASSSSLPGILADHVHADWADFDLDGDNDLLVVTRHIDEELRDAPNQFSYFLENDGQGHFVKRSLNLLPQSPSYRVYLLDADQNEIPDIIILSQEGVHFLTGEGDWQFAEESLRRFPDSVSFKELVFGHVNKDDYLDIFGITSKEGKGRLWIADFD